MTPDATEATAWAVWRKAHHENSRWTVVVSGMDEDKARATARSANAVSSAFDYKAAKTKAGAIE